MIERDPHGWFAGAWAGWFSCVCYALGRPDEPTLGLVVLLAFLPIEAAALAWDNGSRDTLSEVMTWLQRTLSRHQRAVRGWNALVLMVILAICYLLGRTVWYYTGAWYVAIAMAGLAVIWLHDHWISPEVHG